jgi:cysteine desulfurase
MVYLDYSATTPVDERVIESYSKACKDFIGNPNSLHKIGVESKLVIDASTRQIAEILGVKSSEIIYTSGASESNNTAIKGICLKYQNRGKRIITTELEHSSIIAPLNYLMKQGFDVDFVKLDDKGRVDLEDLERLMGDDVILVTISSVNSEVGIKQPLKEISSIVRKYKKCFFHSDMTQSIGKEKVDMSLVDLASLSGQKFFGMKGIGALIKKENIQIEPLIHGGKSTTIYRAGTPATPLIVSLAKALRLILKDLDKKYDHIKELNDYLKEKLSKYPNVYINSNEDCIPHILNFSVVGVKPETMQHALEEYEVYISTQTACSSKGDSKGVMALTGSKERASSSVRVSLSYLTTKEECDKFLEIFTKCHKELTSLVK